MMKKHIKVKFLGTYRQGELVKRCTLYPILEKNFDLELSEDPEFIIASPLDKPFNYCNYNCVRILFTGENFAPDFNVFDYAISSDNISFGDRFYRYQQYNDSYSGDLWAVDASRKHIDVPNDLLEKKQYFCDFIYKNSAGQEARGQMFEKLSQYKRVESAGTWMNNMPGGKVVSWPFEKQDFQKLCKFSIAFDSIRYPGFITEKIVNAFMNRSIPIYLGAPDVEEIFNPKAFIHCANFRSLDEVVEYVKYIDTHDDVYMEMMRQPAFNDSSLPQRNYDGLVKFVVNIFSQDPKAAFRRYPDSFSNHIHTESLRRINELILHEENRFPNRVKRTIRRLVGDEKYELLKNHF